MKITHSKDGGATIALSAAELPNFVAMLRQPTSGVSAARLRVNTIAALVTPPPEKASAFATKADIAAGGGFLCKLGCGKRLRTPERARTHATNATLKAGGHIKADAGGPA